LASSDDARAEPARSISGVSNERIRQSTGRPAAAHPQLEIDAMNLEDSGPAEPLESAVDARAKPAPRIVRRALESAGRDELAIRALMVTDLVAFTELLVRLGDVRAQQLMQLHNRMLRSCIHSHDGIEVTHTGDGVIAAFRSLRGCLKSAADLQQALAEHSARCPHAPLEARIGLHIGEPLPEESRLFGACINTAVRICATAPPGRIWVSDLVRQVAAGQAAAFDDRGPFSLKGLDAPVRLHEFSPTAIQA
jgi:class 3 adenylate cyclase